MRFRKFSPSGFLKDDRGQVLPIVALMLITLIGMAGLVADLGHAYYIRRELQASTDAAALAGAQSLPGPNAVAVANQYSSLANQLNARTNLPGVTMASGYPMLRCLSTLTKQGMPCVAPANANAISVLQRITVPTYFAGVFGKNSVTISTSSTVSMRGGYTAPYNVVIIVDTTASMSDIDSDSNCNNSRLNCALQGVQTLIGQLSPCASSLTTCGTATSGNVANAVDRVSIMTFPNATIATMPNDYDCSGGTSPTIKPYTFPTAGAASYAPTTSTYQVVNFSSDYRASDTSASLASTSNLVQAVNGKSGCTGMQSPGGEGTYFAGVIYAAQAALVAASVTGTQNVIILLSDGDASATTAAMTGASTSSGVYPSTKNQCQQAITAAAAATAAGTRVYTVAYGASSSGCSTDATLTPCTTMQQIASAPQYFFSDYTASANKGNCISASQSTTNLNQIFTQIAGDFTVARVIADNTQ
jgi:hypothetical protein